MIKKCCYAFLIMFMLSFSLNAQSDFIADTTENTQNFKFYQIENYNQILQKKYTFSDLTINTNINKKPFFQKYNNITSLNDLYANNHDGTYTYVRSKLYLENRYRGVKIDSYNPRGMSPNGKSIIFGVFGAVLDTFEN